MAKTIAHHLADLRLDLKDSGAIWSDAELTRCLEKAVADYGRFHPREMQVEVTVDAEVDSESVTTPAVEDTDYFVDAMDISASVDGAACTIATGHTRPDVPRPVQVTVTDANFSITQLVIIVKGYDSYNKYVEEFFYLEGGLVQTGQLYFALVTAVEIDEIAGNGAADVLDVGTGDEDAVYVELDYKPIKFQSEAISGLELDTDYEMDYGGGRIKMKSGGSMAASTAYSIDYVRSRIDLDLSTVIDDLIKIERVEYPVGNVPQLHSDFEVWGNILTVTGGYGSQAEMSDAEHAIIKYLAPHSAPNAQSPGSYPSYLDTTIQLAACAYALLIEALQYELAASVSITAISSALTNAIKYMNNNTGNDAAAVILRITTDIAGLRSAALTALDAANTYLDEVDTTDLTGSGNDSAEATLKAGEDLINAIADGANVAENYSEYSRAWANIAAGRTNAAIGYLQEAATRLDNLRTYVEEASGYTAVFQGFLAEAQLRNEEVNQNLALAAAYREEAIERRNEAWAIWASPSQIGTNYVLGQRSQPA